MRCLVFLPLAFMADVEGFTWFMAYAATVSALVLIARKVSARGRDAEPTVRFA